MKYLKPEDLTLPRIEFVQKLSKLKKDGKITNEQFCEGLRWYSQQGIEQSEPFLDRESEEYQLFIKNYK